MKSQRTKAISILAASFLTLMACGKNAEVSTSQQEVSGPSDKSSTSNTSTATITSSTTSTASSTTRSSKKVDEPSDELPEIQKGVPLTRNGFSDAYGNWRDSNFDVADKSGITGIGSELNQCGTPSENGIDVTSTNDVNKLRIPASHKFHTLKLKVGQSNLSKAVDQSVLIRAVDNTKQIGEIFKVGFDEIKEVEFDITDKNAVFLQFYLDDQVENCGRQKVTVVIFDVILE